jgi:hypothetical protein
MRASKRGGSPAYGHGHRWLVAAVILLVAVSAVLRWEFRPGSTVFLVYSRLQSPELALQGEPPSSLSARCVTDRLTTRFV